jgi:Glycosyl transferase family 2
LSLRGYLDQHFPFPAVVTIADNASTDGTWAIAQRLAATGQGGQALHLDEKGRGRALRSAWSASDADLVAYMDVDLATGLEALPPLVAPLISGLSDVAIGTRLAPGAQVTRGLRREVISRIYNGLVHLVLGTRFSDAQCGFKAMRTDVARALLPHVVDDDWFFDTELLVVAERNGLRIAEVPVDWVDDPDSRVRVVATVVEDLKGLARMRLELTTGRARAELPATVPHRPSLSPVLPFARLGAVLTICYLALFVVLRQPLSPYGAAAASLVGCTTLNAALHWRLASSENKAGAALRLAGTGLAVNLVAATLALAVASALGRTSELDELVALVIALGPTALGRFPMLRSLGGPAPAPAPHLADGDLTAAESHGQSAMVHETSR